MIERERNETSDEYFSRLREINDREDLVMFVNACFAATRQTEYYSDARQQSVSIGFLHQYIMANYRKTYARTLALGINHFNQALIIFNLLSCGAPRDAVERTEEGNLIRCALNRLPPNRVFRLFRKLQVARVNNRRTRAVIAGYFKDRNDPEFDAVKYRRKLRAAARHAHLHLTDEIGKFLFRFKQQKSFKSELLDRYRRAYYETSAIYDLPFTIAEQFANKHGIPRKAFLQKIRSKMTTLERLRHQATAEKIGGASIDIDFSRILPTRLATYILSLSEQTRMDREFELRTALENSVNRVLSNVKRLDKKVAVILDRSRSSSGSSQKKMRPLAVALAASFLFRSWASDCRAFWTTPVEGSELMVRPVGQTSIAQPLIDALKWQPEMVVVVSDGHENDPPGATTYLIRLYKEHLSADRSVDFVHLNPVFDAQHFSPRPLSDTRMKRGQPSIIATCGLREAKDIPTMIGFSRFASGTTPLSELETYLCSRVAEFLEGNDVASNA